MSPGTSVEYTTGIPDVIPCKRRRRRTERASGSYTVDDMSLICILVGSHLVPAPIEENIYRKIQLQSNHSHLYGR